MKLMERSRIGIMAMVATILVTSGCASAPNTVTRSAPGADFSQYSTFGYFESLATDGSGYESILSNFLKVATAQQLDRRGYSYSDSPDLLINFYVHTKEKIRTRTVPSMSAYYAYRDPFYYNPWVGYGAYETQIDQYTVGTLNVDVVDAKSKKLVWEGVVSGRVTDSAIQNLEKSVDDAIAAIMKDFPSR
ncbi:MAG: DUF4136 domain-containing protein [Woeseiaceae bacterium]|nr:DUF4136 domain-containing protein [Woeseiaceae bacterium]